MHSELSPSWIPADAWAAAHNVTASEFILAAQNKLPALSARSAGGVVLIDTGRGYAWLQLMELRGLRRAPEPTAA